MAPDHDLPDEAWALALAGLVLMGPRRLTRLLERWGPAGAWQQVLAGRATLDDPDLVTSSARASAAEVGRRWATEAARVDVGARWRRAGSLGVAVHLLGRPGYPELLAADVEPPAVLCACGPLDEVAARPRVAIVGMRNATGYGTATARRLGAELAEAGVVVVSGLALGIDGAAHQGALEALGGGGAPPVGVVASGHDVVYPRRHGALWRQVAEHGTLLSEVPPGGRPEAWRFPARNRVIAAVAEAVVVVESLPTGGSMYTVEEAERRGRTVLAVPGPIDSPASSGTNRLLAEGALVVRDTDDVLVALGRPPRPAVGGQGQLLGPLGAAATPADRALLDELVGPPRTVAQLAERLGWPLRQAATAVARLVVDGQAVQRGQWVERARGAR